MVALVVVSMFVATAGLTIGESGVGALFLDRVGPDRLPVMYLAQGAVGLVAMLLLTAALGRFERRRTYVALPVTLAAVVLAERIVAAADPPWIYAALWLTVTVAFLVQAVFLWGVAGLVTDTRRAKRLFPLFAGGSILGAVLGGLVTRPLAAAIGVANLLVVWAGGLAGTAALCAALLGVGRRAVRVRRARRTSALTELGRGFSFVRRSSLLRWMTVAAVLFSVLFYSLYLPYAQAATARFPDPDDLAGFFGIFWASVTAAAFVVSVLVTNRLLGWFGAAAVVLVLPLLYAGTFGILLATSTFGMLVALRFGVNVWLQGVTSPAWETLVNVVPEDRRDQTRAFLNGGPTQVGTAIAGVVQLVGQHVLSAAQLTVIGLAAATITLAATWMIRRSYPAALVDALRAGRPKVFGEVLTGAPIVLHHDGRATALALEALGDADPRVRRLAVAMLDPGEERAAAGLSRALEDDDAQVRSNALKALARGAALDAGELERALGDGDASVRQAAVHALRRTSSETSTPKTLLADPSAAVAAAAAVNLLRGPERREAADALRHLLSGDGPGGRIEALAELRSAVPEDVAAFVTPLATDGSPALRAAALRSLVAASPEVAIPPALEGLASPEPVVRDAALAALSELDLRGSEDALRRSAAAWAELAEADRSASGSVPAEGEVRRLLRDALTARGRTRAMAALSALAVLAGERDAARAAIDGLDSSDARQRANALETLEVAVGPSARPLLALWEVGPDGAQAGRADSLERLMEDEDPVIRACARLADAGREEGDQVTRSTASMSTVDRILALRRIPLFAELSPQELHRVADIAEEHTYADGDQIAAEGELGEELHIVLEGTVRVSRGDRHETIARRGPGDVVGEMSIITRAPRVASLVADGDVRTVRLGSRDFEGMIRERPDVALAIMRVLAARISTETTT